MDDSHIVRRSSVRVTQRNVIYPASNEYCLLSSLLYKKVREFHDILTNESPNREGSLCRMDQCPFKLKFARQNQRYLSGSVSKKALKT